MTPAPAQLAVLVMGSISAFGSLVCTIAAILELSVILGPVSVGPIRITSWWSPSAVLLVVWLVLLGIAGWQLHEGWTDAVPYLAIGAFFVVMHKLLLTAYWVRRILRKQQAKELPTQELLTEAQRVMMAANGEVPVTTQQVGQSNRFQLQVGRMDGVSGFTLYIPAEEEEQVFEEAKRRKAAEAAQLAAVNNSSRHAQYDLTGAAASGPYGALVPSPPRNKQSAIASALGGSGRVNTGSGRVNGGVRNSTSPSRSEADMPMHPAHRGLVSVLLPEELGLWRPQQRSQPAASRYRMLTTEPSLNSPGPPTLGVRADSNNGNVFGSGGREQQGGGSPGLVQANNPLVHGGELSLGQELSFRQSQSQTLSSPVGQSPGAVQSPAGVQSPASVQSPGPQLQAVQSPGAGQAAGAASAAAQQGPAPGGTNQQPTAAAPAAVAASPGAAGTTGVATGESQSTALASPSLAFPTRPGMGRLSLDPSLIRNGSLRSTGVTSPALLNPRHVPSASAGSAQWVTVQQNPQLLTAPATSDTVLRSEGGRRESEDLRRGDSAKAGLLDDVPISSSTVDAGRGARSPRPGGGTRSEAQVAQVVTSSSAGGDSGAVQGDARKGGGGGLLTGRLFQAHHTRTRSFPLASSLTSALLQHHDSSGDVVVGDQGRPERVLSKELLSPGSFRFSTPQQA